MNRRIVIGILTVIFCIAAAYLGEQLITIQGNKAGIIVELLQNNEKAAYIDADVIKELNIQEKQYSISTASIAKSNETSLWFTLCSAGINDFLSIEIEGIKEAETYQIDNIRDIDKLALAVNDNSTVALVNREAGNKVLIDAVTKIYVSN